MLQRISVLTLCSLACADVSSVRRLFAIRAADVDKGAHRPLQLCAAG